MTVKEILDKSTAFLKQKGIETPRLDSEFLLAHTMKLRRMDLYLKFDQPVQENEINKSRDFIVRRSKNEPVAYITGEKDFYKSTFHVGPGVLIPRPETELLVEKSVDWLKKHPKESCLGLDLGSGTGCIAISIALEIPNIHFHVVEKSEKAFAYLVKNIQRMKLEERITAHFMGAEEFFEKYPQFKFDLIVSNPPYIDPKDSNVQEGVRQFEPAEALFAEREGLVCIRDWSQKFSRRLNDSFALMMFEIGWQQGPTAQEAFEFTEVFQKVVIMKDYSKHDRFVIGEKQNG